MQWLKFTFDIYVKDRCFALMMNEWELALGSKSVVRTYHQFFVDFFLDLMSTIGEAGVN